MSDFPDCLLHIPYPDTDDPDEEEINWYVLMRLVERLSVCGCVGDGPT